MKTCRLFVFVILLSAVLYGCEKDDSDNATKGETNARLIAEILRNNPVKFVHVYEYDRVNSEWLLAADNQSYAEGGSQFFTEGSYFYLDGSGDKSYYALRLFILVQNNFFH